MLSRKWKVIPLLMGSIYTMWDSYPGYIKNHYNGITKTKTQLKWAKYLNRDFTKEKIFSPKKIYELDKLTERYSASSVIGELQIKTTGSYHLTPTRAATTRKVDSDTCVQGPGRMEDVHTASGGADRCSHSGTGCQVLQKRNITFTVGPSNSTAR